MLLEVKYWLIWLIFLNINWVNGMCPYANAIHHQKFNSVLLCDTDVQDDIYKNYMLSPTSYDTYNTDCHHFITQPPPISDTIIHHALQEANDQTIKYEMLDNEFINASPAPVPAFLTDMDRNNYYFESATKYVQETSCTSKTTTTLYLPLFQLDHLPENATKVVCEHGNIESPSCLINSPYRSIDGICNNVEKPLQGSRGDSTRRLLPPDYKDGVSQLRTSMDGSPLPNSRLLSTQLLGKDDVRPLSTRFTQFHAFFGEFVISDSGMTLSNNVGMGINIRCCDRDGLPRDDHPQCAAFFVPPDDDDLNHLYPHQKCMEFVRTIPSARCRLGPRLISNSVTAAQDLNSVYGVSISMLNARRTMIDGGLVSQMEHGEELFAVERSNASGRYRCLKGYCEVSPLDVRNVQLPTGQALALLFHRNHNRHARILATIKPDWNDEMIFQEARKLNVAQYQHCIYNEYIETLLGAELTDYFDILPKPNGQFSNYEPDVQLKTITEFQSTAGRHGHAALSEDLFITEPQSGREFEINFRQSELYESIFYDGHVSGMFLGQMSRPAFETTASIPFKTFLYDAPGRTFGLDLASLDIQRQRDHGIPGYINYLKYCHDVDVNSWKDLRQFIDSNKIQKLKQHYRYVEDVELYVGGHYERKIDDSVVGPTFACIIGIQFHNSKYGDRFFYEHGEQINSFTIEQLNEIKSKSTLANILCKNTNLDEVLVDPFRVLSHNNQFVSCSEFDDIDYSCFR